MTTFVDTYLKSKSKEALEAKRQFHSHMLTVMPGFAGAPAVGKEGEEGYQAAMPPAGDPAYWYTCIRSDGPVLPNDEVEACSAEEGAQVVGVWA